MFESLILKVLPLYALIAVGYAAGRWVNVSHRQIADFTIYFIGPVVVFCMLWQADLSGAEALVFPLVVAVLTVLMAGGSYLYGRKVWGDKRKNLFAAQIMGGNTGYFGIPVAFALFAAETANLWILVMLVSTVLQLSLGYYLLATGDLSPTEGLKKLLRLPPFYAMLAGLAINFSGIMWIEGLNETYQMFRGAFFVLGMSIIGLSIARLSRAHLDMKYIFHALVWRFPVWTAVVLAIIAIDSQWLHWLDARYHGLILLMGVLPLAADPAAYAAQLNLHPEKAASAVLVSTLVALVYIPAIMGLIYK